MSGIKSGNFSFDSIIANIKDFNEAVDLIRFDQHTLELTIKELTFFSESLSSLETIFKNSIIEALKYENPHKRKNIMVTNLSSLFSAYTYYFCNMNMIFNFDKIKSTDLDKYYEEAINIFNTIFSVFEENEFKKIFVRDIYQMWYDDFYESLLCFKIQDNVNSIDEDLAISHIALIENCLVLISPKLLSETNSNPYKDTMFSDTIINKLPNVNKTFKEINPQTKAADYSNILGTIVVIIFIVIIIYFIGSSFQSFTPHIVVLVIVYYFLNSLFKFLMFFFKIFGVSDFKNR